jgi:endonuclease/exonuclease/phosphatase family metal-dependent hydrolase
MVDRIAGVAVAGALVAGGFIALDGWASWPTGQSTSDTSLESSADESAPPGESVSLGSEDATDAETGGPGTGDASRGSALDPRPRQERTGRFRVGTGKKAKAEVEEVPDSGTGMRVVPAEMLDSAALSAVTVDFTVASFNVFGSSHTAPGGKKAGWPSGVSRIAGTAELIRHHEVGIVGLQELQRDQMSRLVGILDEYAIFPGPSMGWRESENSIIWRTDQWYPVQSSTIAIPYFNGRTRQMPYIRLRNSTTGTDIWVANFHNPANTGRFGAQSHWRAEATRRQIALANELQRRTGVPVVFTGDFNDRAGYFCALVGNTDMHASNGGSAEGGRCSPPPGMQIDWVFGTPEIAWTDSLVDRSPLGRQVSDHPMVLASGRLNVVDQEVVEEAAEGLARMGATPGG